MSARALVSRLWGSLTRHRHEQPLAEEIDAHLAMLADEFVARGMTPTQARAAARREFGSVEATKDSTRDERGFPWLASLLQDVRYALRQLRQHRGFALAAILTLTLGIGASAGIFSVVDTVLLRPLPYPDPERLVVLHEQAVGRGTIPVSPADADAWRQASTSLAQFGLLSPANANLTGGGEPEQVRMDLVTPDVLPMLGARTLAGRLFRADEGLPGNERVVVLSHALWQRRFNSNPSIVGQTIDVDGVAHVVVGVLSAETEPPSAIRLYTLSIATIRQPQLWKPLTFTPAQRPAIGNNSYAAIARLASGVSLEQARGELAAIQARLVGQIPGKGQVEVLVMPLREQLAGRSRDGLRLLAIAVLAVLIIGCGNIVNLLLARSLARQRELAVREALGAGRGRLVRQLIVENITLCAISGSLSLLVAYAVMRFLVANAPADVPRLEDVSFDARVVGFVIVASIVVGLLIAVLPALRIGTSSVVSAVTTRGSIGQRGNRRVRAVLVSTQIAISMTCLVAAALLLQSFVRLLNVDRGFDQTEQLTIELNLGGSRYDENTRAEFLDGMIARLQAMPGVVSAAAANRLPLTGTGGNSALSVEGTTLPVPERPLADERSVSLDYFRTLGLPLQSGRLFTRQDLGRQVAVLSANLAAHAWPGQDAIGRTFRFGSNPSAPLFEVIGVVDNVRNRALDEPPTESAYVPYPMRAGTLAVLLVNASAGAGPLSSQVRDALRTADPNLPIPALRTLDQIVAQSMSLRRFQLQLVMFFGVAAALLTAIGIYGLMAYAVTQRTAEFGVRLALGARPRAVLGAVLRDAAALTVGGLAAAIPMLIATGPALRSLLYDVRPTDPSTVVAVALLVGATALAAAYLPGRRASRIQPTVALRVD